MSETNCPNCGAPKRGSVCEYCGTHFGRYQGEVTAEVEEDSVTVYGWNGLPVARFSNGTNTHITIDRCAWGVMTLNEARERKVEG